GYHLLDSLVGFTDFGDRLTIEPAQDSPSLVNLEITGPFAAGLLTGTQKELDNNLVTRAAMALAEFYQKSGYNCQNVRIILEKNMPVTSGIGGGSADAAAALLLLQKIWKNGFTPDVPSIAVNLGADVSMCLSAQPKRIRGTGELISEFGLPVSLPVLLVNPRVPLPTPNVFCALADKNNLPISFDDNVTIDQSSNQSDVSDTNLVENVVEILSPLRNDLQIPAISLVPDIQNVLLSIERQSGCLLARMSGSGATCFGIFSTPAQVNDALIGIKETNPHWWSVACGTIPMAADRLP
ncbi:MAG: 4-(cytidine 5'-diphospho)-2-C-methyl-D-erythritol kinase, partial [Hyphomicrobiales bacterium]|nr:4-(cytidine 5'-diphospho)-2-C-methyl-D-erythritol kinase [Hyphomicrobiales bacterium]